MVRPTVHSVTSARWARWAEIGSHLLRTWTATFLALGPTLLDCATTLPPSVAAAASVSTPSSYTEPFLDRADQGDRSGVSSGVFDPSGVFDSSGAVSSTGVLGQSAFVDRPGILDQFTVQVRAEVLPYQRVEIREPVQAEFSYPWPGAEKGTPLLLAAVGVVELESNSPWQLALGVSLLPGFQIDVRPAGQADATWMPVGPNQPPALVGSAGTHRLRWDIRIVPTPVAHPGRYRFGLTTVASVL